MTKKRKSLGPLALALINISAILSLRHLPAQAFLGFSSLWLYLVGAIIFLIPLSLICAELATTWPNRHGLYGWVYEAFGPRTALLVVWWSWMASIATIVTNLLFLSVLIFSLLYPTSQISPSFVLLSSLIVLWSMTILNLFGMKLSSLISSAGAILGTIAPICLLIVMSFVFLWTHETGYLPTFSLKDFIHHSNDLGFLTTIILGYTGIELAAFHAADAKNPQKDYFKALMIAAIIIATLYIFGTLAILLILPSAKLSLTLGVIHTFEQFFNLFHLETFLPLMIIAMILGTLAAINSWLISPAKGVFAATEHFRFPTWLTRSNSYFVPVNIIMLQAMIASLLLILLKTSKSVESAFWILTMLTTQFAVVLYLPIILGFIKLKYYQKDKKRPFSLSLRSSWICASLAFIASIFTLIMTFIPPEKISLESALLFKLFLIFSFIILSLPAYLLKKY